jgi:hypothetical protein
MTNVNNMIHWFGFVISDWRRLVTLSVFPIKAWEQKIKSLAGWQHLRAAEGVNSKAAADYFVLATP